MEYRIIKRSTIVWEIVDTRSQVVAYLMKAPAGGRSLVDMQKRTLRDEPFRDVKLALEWFEQYIKDKRPP